MSQRLITLATSGLLVGGLFFGAPSPIRAATDPTNVYISFETPADTGRCASPDYTAAGIEDHDIIMAAVTATTAGGTLHFCPGPYDINETINLAGKLITLKGADAATTTLDGGGTTQILTSSGAITVSDLTFRDGFAVFGGAIYSDTVTVTRGSFIGNTATDRGGAIFAYFTTTVADSTFIGNSAEVFGGAIFTADNESTASATVTGSTFTGNDANNGNGGAVSGWRITSTGSTFTGNSAHDGGAIWAVTTATVTVSTFTNNSAEWGGAINAMSTTVTKSVFRSNLASLNGGGIYAAETAMVTGSVFTGNDSGKNGGAIYADTSATITNSTFKNNSAAIDGGAISTSTATVTASTFTQNSAEYGGAITAPFATVTRSRFTGNSAFSLGGAFFTYDGTIQRSRFTRNAAGEHGGAVAFWAANSDTIQRLRRNTFTRNTAPAGGAITLRACAPSYSRSQVRRIERASYFSRNRATEQRRTENVERWIAVEYCG